MLQTALASFKKILWLTHHQSKMWEPSIMHGNPTLKLREQINFTYACL